MRKPFEMLNAKSENAEILKQLKTLNALDLKVSEKHWKHKKTTIFFLLRIIRF